eukprot:TRINITY_DN18588_c0_g1_i1.p1 TRINITY_DN18588_c0_g1~~TRINITY_DN18588_c0_g1_i1.p1  ORF type:complete len:363 (-),score=43.40 TRINITY_DN18588_c0_g1_i1:67-1155(-)
MSIVTNDNVHVGADYSWFAWAAIIASVLLMAMQPIVVTLSMDETGKVPYSVPCSVAMTELTKFVMAFGALTYQRLFTSPPKPIMGEAPLREVMLYLLPALLYLVPNNLIFFILESIDPVTYQLLSQLKTLLTGILFWLFLKKRLVVAQWLALVVLSCGTAVSQLGPADFGSNSSPKSLPAYIGLVLSLATAICSSLAGIYNEKLMKDRSEASVHFQNMQLYGWSFLFNVIAALATSSPSDLVDLEGFSLMTWVVILTNAVMGLTISAVLKFADNIARVYAHAIAMVLTMVVQVFTGSSFTAHQIIAVILVSTSTIQYSLPPPREEQKANADNRTVGATKASEYQPFIVSESFTSQSPSESGN